MKHLFLVTSIGPTIDKATILEGSELVLTQRPPSHWSRFGEYKGMVDERELVVATPEPSGEAEASEEPASSDDEGATNNRPAKAKTK